MLKTFMRSKYKKYFKQYFNKDITLSEDDEEFFSNFINEIAIEYKIKAKIHKGKYDFTYLTREKIKLESDIKFLEKSKDYNSYFPILISTMVTILIFGIGKVTELNVGTIKNAADIKLKGTVDINFTNRLIDIYSDILNKISNEVWSMAIKLMVMAGILIIIYEFIINMYNAYINRKLSFYKMCLDTIKAIEEKKI